MLYQVLPDVFVDVEVDHGIGNAQHRRRHALEQRPYTLLADHASHDASDAAGLVLPDLRMQGLRHHPGSYDPDWIGYNITKTACNHSRGQVLFRLGEVSSAAVVLQGLVDGEEDGVEDGDGLHIDPVP